ncbi:MAG: DUF973 family protein [Staphylothermus sp.]|nr:DUF973 family protein [Staphylothermus sp.]
METRKYELIVEGLRMIKEGSLFVIIGSLIISIASIALISILPFSVFSIQHTVSPPPPVPHLIGPIQYKVTVPIFLMNLFGIYGLIIVIVTILIGAGLSLYGLYGKIIPGAERLATADSRYSTAYSLLKIGYLGGLGLLIIGVLTLMIIIGVFFIVLALILLLIGKIGMALITFKLNEDYGESIMLIAGILFIIGIFIGFAEFIAWILVYLGIGSVIKIVETRVQQYQPPPPPSPETPVI